MRYFRLLNDISDDPNVRQWHIEFPVWTAEKWTMCDGISVADWDTTLIGHYPPYGIPVDFPIVLSDWHVHSTRLRCLLEESVPKQIEYLSFQLTAAVGHGSINGYYVANYLNLLDCLHREKTQVIRDWLPVNPLGDFAVETPVLDKSKIGASKLFRVRGDSGLVVVREDLRLLLDNVGISGCTFEEVEVG